MVALDLWFIKIYWYGIFYALSFVLWYYIIKYCAKYIYTKYSKSEHIYNIYKTIHDELEDIVIYICAWVIIGGRFWEVLIYNWAYYSENLIKIFALQDGWMSFVWGFLWVMIAIFIYKFRKNWGFDDVLYLFDLIVLVLPIGIVLWRLGNYLNQELVGQTISDIYNKYNLTYLFGDLWKFEEFCSKISLCHIYDRVDDSLRLNNNLLEWFLEWLVTGLVWLYVRSKKYIYNLRAWMITWIFMIIYAFFRIIMENFRDNPPSEYIYGLLKSQLWMVWFLLFWIWLLYRSIKR